jgi:hypothetical protein
MVDLRPPTDPIFNKQTLARLVLWRTGLVAGNRSRTDERGLHESHFSLLLSKERLTTGLRYRGLNGLVGSAKFHAIELPTDIVQIVCRLLISCCYQVIQSSSFELGTWNFPWRWVTNMPEKYFSFIFFVLITNFILVRNFELVPYEFNFVGDGVVWSQPRTATINRSIFNLYFMLSCPYTYLDIRTDLSPQRFKRSS